MREANHAERNDAAAISEMMPEVYEDLRRLAETFLRGERTAHTLQRTALVHEAFLRLIGEKNLVWQNRSHFIGIFARVMRQTLTNYAVARHRLKRGGSDPLRLTLEFYDSRKIDVTALDQALQALEVLDERQARIVELRFFGGLTVEETADVTGNFAGHGEAGLDPGENLASARTICELGIQILRGHKNYPIRAREHRSATLGSLENDPGRSVGTKLFSGPDCLGGETLRSRYGFARRGRVAPGRSGGAS